jgi:UDP-glucose:(heptosyl)LPS alpha-1,3-glucosyltransferase
MKTPKVAFVRQRYAQDGGAERFVSRALDALRSRNVSLTLVAREWHGGEGFDVITCNPFYLGRLWRDWSFARAVCRELGKRSFDLVQSHERLSCCDVYRAGDGVHREWLRQRARILSLWGRIGIAVNPYHWYVKNAERKVITGARAIICISQMVKREIVEYFGVPEAKLHVIYNGIDTLTFHPQIRKERQRVRQRLEIPANATVFLFVGSGFERKGVGRVLEALAMQRATPYLLVVGHDKHLARYQHQARRLGLMDRVRFVGVQKDVKPYYAAADAFVFPTIYEPFGNVILEAMATGLPVITSFKCGGAEIIQHGINGYVCDSLDRDALIEYMEKLANVGECARMGVAARAAVERMTLDNMAIELDALYEQLLAR